tara:strand:- start:1383 stop:1529 length:147 start_codon:yes stop_codon:yes gene_type:complete
MIFLNKWYWIVAGFAFCIGWMGSDFLIDALQFEVKEVRIKFISRKVKK